MPTPWSQITKQAREIRRRKTRNGQARQAQLWFDMVRDALSVRDVQPDPGADLDPGPSADVPGQVVADLIARCKG